MSSQKIEIDREVFEALVAALQQIDGMLVELNQCNYDADDVAEQNHSVCVAIQTAKAALAKVKT